MSVIFIFLTDPFRALRGLEISTLISDTLGAGSGGATSFVFRLRVLIYEKFLKNRPQVMKKIIAGVIFETSLPNKKFEILVPAFHWKIFDFIILFIFEW